MSNPNNKIYLATAFFISCLLFMFSSCRENGISEKMTESAEKWREKYPESPGEKKVEILNIDGRFQFYRNGKPYYVKGGAGTAHLALLKEAGGNSIRTYSVEGLDTLLDQAEVLGLSVMVGIYLGRPIEGFDYQDQEAVTRQKERVRDVIIRYKDHPAVLCWGLGNEPDLGAGNTHLIWQAMNDLAVMIRQIDPDHPVSIPVYPFSIHEVMEQCPDIDFISVNTFGHIIEFSEQFQYGVPYMYTEWGALGPWEDKDTYWHASVEESIVGKYHRIQSHYEYIRRDTQNCLGSYIFLWGQKQEYTPTWFSLFTENGAKTPLVDLMFSLWNNSKPTNLSPFLDSLTIDGWGADFNVNLKAGQVYSASVKGFDPEHDPISYHWEILPDGPFYTYLPGRGKEEIRPDPIPDLIIQDHGNRILFQAPASLGPFRILVYAYDTHGNGSYANLPFLSTNHELTEN
jgi:hypothetical protein